MTVRPTIKRVLITGIAGSGGSYLAEYIIDNCPAVEVYGFSRCIALRIGTIFERFVIM